MEKQKTTIYDIAYRAGVSQSTVSRVLSGSTNVSEDKKLAVLNTVEALGYRPNLFAQRLASGEASAVGILATNTETPFFTQVIRGIQETLAPSPYLERAVELLRASYVGGVCVVGQALPPKLLKDLQTDMPVFAVCPDTPGIEAQCLLEGGAYRATKHLLDQGHRRIAHIAGPPDHPHAIGRMAGYRRALKEAGVAFDPKLVAHGNSTEPSGIDAANEILQNAVKFSALFAANDCMTFVARVALYRKGLHVPTHVSLVGFDDSPQAAFRTPPLTTVSQPAVLMGAAVAKQILAALTNNRNPRINVSTRRSSFENPPRLSCRFKGVTKPLYIALLALAGLVPIARAQAAPLTCTSARNGACMVADTFSLEFDSQGLPLAVVNFGLFAATASPGAFATICEEAFGGRTPENITVSNGKILVPSRQGVFVATEPDLCNWVLAKGLPADALVQQTVVDPLVPTRIWALVGAGDDRGLYKSEDQGTTFSLQHQFKRGEVWWRLSVLASTPRKVIVSGAGLVGPFAVGISIDDGKTFVNRDPVPFLGTAADSFRTSILVAASSPPSSRLYFVRDTADGRDELWVSDDDAQSAKPVLAMPNGHLLGGFAFGAAENIVYVGSRASLVTGKSGDSVLFTSSDGGTTWAPPIPSPESGPHFRCLKFRDGFLYACGGGVDAGDAAYISRSADGVAWDPVIAMPQVQAPAECMRERCADTTAWLCTTYGVCPPPKLDAGAADAGAPEAAPSGCSCHVGVTQQRGQIGAFATLCIACGARHLRARKKRRKLRP